MNRLFAQNKFIRLLSISVLGLSIYSSVTNKSLAFSSSSTSAVKASPKEVIDQVWHIIYREYLDANGNYNNESWINKRKEILLKRYLSKGESYDAIREMLSSLDDPYTRFLDPKEFKEMRIDTTGELMGVGIQITLDEETKRIIVVSPIEGTPAYRAGVMANDIITSIDGKQTKGLSIEDAVKLIRGRKGSKVNLGLIREGRFIQYELIRDRIAIRAVTSRKSKSTDGLKIGYIRLKQFNANSPREMKEVIQKLERDLVDGYLLDLRSNPGGLLEASIEIARQWLDQGIIVSTRTKDGIQDIRRAKGRALTNKPLVVLINEGSASASEILSGSIQDNKRGLLVGKKTFGKGLVQSVRGLSDGSGLTVTIAKYLTPNGKDIHNNGILPDIKSDLSNGDDKTFTVRDIGTSKDKQYKTAEYNLIKQIKAKSLTYIPGTPNIRSALIK